MQNFHDLLETTNASKPTICTIKPIHPQASQPAIW